MAADFHGEPDDEWREILHEELGRLSEKYRLPILLCDLEGKTHAQAAAELNCGEATVRRRLASARDLLRSRLARRGIALTTAALATALGRSALAKVPPGLTEITVKAAGQMGSAAARIALGEVVSRTAGDLARRSLRVMLLTQLKAGVALAALMIAMVGIAWGVGTYGQDGVGSPAAPRMQGARSGATAHPAQSGTEKPANPDDVIAYQGRVLDPEGRPFAGASLSLVTRNLKQPADPPIRASSGPDGRFRFSVSRSDFDTSHSDAPWSDANVLARATGFAFAQSKLRHQAGEMTLQLVRDDVPLSGRVIDLDGQPVAGAAVTVLEVLTPTTGSLDGWLKAIEIRKELFSLEHEFLPTGLSISDADPPMIAPVKTGADGRFVITGIGRERVATLEIQGSTIETVHVQVRTRPGATIRVPGYAGADADELQTIYGATFDHVAGPTRAIEGVVRDIDTKAPLTGIMVRGERSLGNVIEYVRAITDARGHYRLVGLPREREGHVLAVPPVDYPLSADEKAAPQDPSR